MATLLLDERGDALARRYARTLAAAHPFQLSSSTGQQLLVHGEHPARVVSLAEAMATAEPLASLVTRAPDEAGPGARKTAWDLKIARREKCLDAVSDLASLLDAYARASADPAVIAAAIRVAHVILGLGPVTDATLEATAIVLRKGLARKRALPRGYLDILLAYQDRIWASRHPDRRDLTVRIANLHTRLANRDRMLADLHDEIAERLRQATAEAQLAAAEHTVQSLYRSHLEKIAGPIPAGLAIDDDLINAVLLATDVRHNRRLLRRLLRA